MLRNIYLYGNLEQFGGVFRLDVDSVSEAVYALCMQIKGFRDELIKGAYHVFRGSILEGCDLGVEELDFLLGKADIHILPVIEGSGRFGKIILGVALATFAFVSAGSSLAAMSAAAPGFLGSTFGMTFGSLAFTGVMMAVQGVVGLLSPTQKTNLGQNGAANQRQSYIFNGPVNTQEQGGPVPILYGEGWTGSVVASAGMEADKQQQGNPAPQTNANGSQFAKFPQTQ